jgi:citrate synthase
MKRSFLTNFFFLIFTFNDSYRVMTHSSYHDGLDRFIKAFRHDSHPMGMMSTLIAAMSTFYPEANPAYVGANIYKSK